MGGYDTTGGGCTGTAGTGTVYDFQTCSYTIPVCTVYGYATGIWLCAGVTSVVLVHRQKWSFSNALPPALRAMQHQNSFITRSVHSGSKHFQETDVNSIECIEECFLAVTLEPFNCTLMQQSNEY